MSYGIALKFQTSAVGLPYITKRRRPCTCAEINWAMSRHVQAARLASFVLGCLSGTALGMLMTIQSGHSSFNR